MRRRAGRHPVVRPPKAWDTDTSGWADDLADPPAFFAGGHCGQYIYVVPTLDPVVVTTTDAYAGRPFGRALRTLIESYVARAMRP